MSYNDLDGLDSIEINNRQKNEFTRKINSEHDLRVFADMSGWEYIEDEDKTVEILKRFPKIQQLAAKVNTENKSKIIEIYKYNYFLPCIHNYTRCDELENEDNFYYKYIQKLQNLGDFTFIKIEAFLVTTLDRTFFYSHVGSYKTNEDDSDYCVWSAENQGEDVFYIQTYMKYLNELNEK